MHKGFPKSDINRDLEQRREALEKESAYQYKQLHEIKIQIKKAFDKITDICEGFW